MISLGLAACGGGGGSGATAETTQASTAAKEIYKYPLPVRDGTFAEEHPGYADYGSPPLVFEMDPSGHAYTSKKAMAKEGNVTIELVNRGSTPQNIAVEDIPLHQRVVTEPVKEGIGAVSITLDIKDKYIFYSTIPGQREAGMEGVLKITPRN